ncbi:probable plastid-lipid-associated protein 14, chloroplastic [Hibiscus syriacus]|uniref:probable plastid-lipid-associated protein 14, chloroplastic n=1 Tax=Hibiscus syriacus TaxID=106335 RepID=UPI00192081FA|nr:probable plastid-lipid-associated protein 14, chloroplastic [Hibiscus syriacus]
MAWELMNEPRCLSDPSGNTMQSVLFADSCMIHYSSLTLVHGYHGSFSLRHWLQQPNWLPTLEATLALDEESVRRVGDDSVGGPAVSRQLRLIRILMRDLLIGVNYLHCHGIAMGLRIQSLALLAIKFPLALPLIICFLNTGCLLNRCNDAC